VLVKLAQCAQVLCPAFPERRQSLPSLPRSSLRRGHKKSRETGLAYFPDALDLLAIGRTDACSASVGGCGQLFHQSGCLGVGRGDGIGRQTPPVASRCLRATAPALGIGYRGAGCIRTSMSSTPSRPMGLWAMSRARDPHTGRCRIGDQQQHACRRTLHRRQVASRIETHGLRTRPAQRYIENHSQK